MKDRDERPFDAELFEDLRVIRKRLADDLSIPPYAVFHDRTLKEMARRYPQSLEAFAAIPGVGNAKLQKFGEIFIAAIGNRRNGRPGGEVPECPPAMAGEGRMLAAGDATATPGGEHPEPAVQSGTPGHPRTPDEIPDDRLLDEAYALQGYIRELREELREAEELHKALLERAHGLGIRENEAYAVTTEISRRRHIVTERFYERYPEVFVKIAKVTIGAAEKAVGKEELEECVEYEESERLSVRSKAP